ncbi:acyl carrier protein [Geoalkalibacter halelectricus]|uniref:Acyl carrier protein n=1 Tax=Geoalkalibacter halelectricus TaxID=2847045 RepID=A0ABY5ZQS0_9BACT|nr:acyl carrier protein [Geoalkalibacter halelectricus]MDO3377975.1 acyl carrier protein [Geoalkalibacter halelectricus]UWZ81522.1 acyl carrier protein [Geoalkalibacter halelectricus]
MTVKETIIELMREVAEATDAELVADLNDETILLQSGLDSLGFAILVARLEEQLGYDPFTLMEEPFYPHNLEEFVSIYVRFAP